MSSEPPTFNGPAHHILVVANRTCPCENLLTEVRDRAERLDSEVLILAPALNKRVRHWVSDTDDAVMQAQTRLAAAVETLRDARASVRGTVGDADPARAIEDTLREFPADEIIISTHPPGDSNWLEKNLLDRARRLYDGPITHLVSKAGLDAPAPPEPPAA